MEKNITPNNQLKKPSFFKTFLYVFSIFLILQMLFGKKENTSSTTQAIQINETEQIERNLIPFETKSLKGNFNTIGLRLDDIILTQYKQTIQKDSPNVELLKYIEDSTKTEEKSSYIELGFLTNTTDKDIIPNNKTKWNIENKTNNSITLSWTNKDKVKFIRNLSFDENYMLTINEKVINNSNKDLNIFPYGRIVYAHNTLTPPTSSHTGFTGFLNKSLEEYNYAKISKEKNKDFNNTNGWFGFTSDYFMTILIPEQNSNFNARILQLGTNELPNIKTPSPYKQYQADYVSDEIQLKKGETKEITTHVYIGAKQSNIIAQYEKEFSIPKFELVIDYGYFYILSKPFTQILKWFYAITGNFGIAIILFTILIRALLFPIAQKSFKSMEKMKKIQPEMKRIQTLYANDKQRMNIELAMLYKRSGINPLSGCLPLLLQIPVFFALYKSLVISIEMRQAPFFGWIKDLSVADPTSIFNLFGLLPYEPYSWLPHLGILPIIMGLTMYIQQMMQPNMSLDPTQAKIMKFLPILFTIMFAGLPSGLVLYWSVNNILSIIQQRFIK